MLGGDKEYEDEYNKEHAKKFEGGGLWANINARKKAGTSRSKSNSTISSKAYSNMKKGFPKKNGGYYSKYSEVGPIIDTINKVSGNILTSAGPISVFRDIKNIGKNKKSVSYEMTFQAIDRTLEDSDVNPIIDEIIRIVKKDFNAKLRL